MLAIPNSEYTRRIKRFQENIRAAGLDAALVHANEADFANVRYLSEYWPTFEAAGVFVPAEGSPVLIIGPESEAYARTRSKIKQIALMVEYRRTKVQRSMIGMKATRVYIPLTRTRRMSLFLIH